MASLINVVEKVKLVEIIISNRVKPNVIMKSEKKVLEAVQSDGLCLILWPDR